MADLTHPPISQLRRGFTDHEKSPWASRAVGGFGRAPEHTPVRGIYTTGRSAIPIKGRLQSHDAATSSAPPPVAKGSPRMSDGGFPPRTRLRWSGGHLGDGPRLQPRPGRAVVPMRRSSSLTQLSAAFSSCRPSRLC
jgi:hypothetical protein